MILDIKNISMTYHWSWRSAFSFRILKVRRERVRVSGMWGAPGWGCSASPSIPGHPRAPRAPSFRMVLIKDQSVFWTGLRVVPFARTILYNSIYSYHILPFFIYNVKCKVHKVDSRYLAIHAATNCPHQTWPNKTPATRSNTNKSHSCSNPFQCFLSAFTKHVKFLSLVDESRYI